MSMDLRVQASDPELERLLLYLDGLNYSQLDKEFLLQRGLAWLKLANNTNYMLRPSSTARVTLSIGDIHAPIPEPTSTLPQPA